MTDEENRLLTQTGKGTPCGELMRRHWQPAALSDDLSADKPLPAQLFGEELILFRDGAGKPALIGRYCAHQGVDMIYGRVEPDGLRCMYHGWLFDNCGRVVLRGDWLEEKERRWDVGQPAYPCVEAGGMIFTYMGPNDPPALPGQEFFATLPPGCAPIKVPRGENYLRGIADAGEAPHGGVGYVIPNVLAPRQSRLGAASWLRWHVPVDDSSHVEFALCCVDETPFAGESLGDAHEILLKAIHEISKEPQTPPGVAEKIS